MQTVEISKKNLLHNLRQFRKRVGKRIKIMAVVKANAYGHGILEVSKIASRSGADWLGVASLEEGLFLRQQNLNLPILVLGYIPLSGIEEAVRNDLSFLVYNLQTIKQAEIKAKKVKRKAKVHIKVETGTNRQGVAVSDLSHFAKLDRKSVV